MYRHILEQEPAASCDQQLMAWSELSEYNTSILHDVKNDMALRKELSTAYFTDPSKFWTILITHRAALHSHMPPREGNFWRRMIGKVKPRKNPGL